METPSIMYLTPEDIQKARLPYETICQLVESVFIEHGNNRFQMPPKPSIHPYDNTFVHIMPGYLPKFKALGLKYVMAWFDNPAKNLPSLGGVIILNDLETGLPNAIMDTAWISNVRTAAVTALSIKYLAPKNAEVLGIVGTGIQARQHVALLNEVAPDIKTINIYDINREVADKFKEDAEKLTRFNINLCYSAEKAISASDIVVTMTGIIKKKTYLLDWVKSGTLVLPVHAGGWDPQLLHRADLLIFDDYLQCKNFFGSPGCQYYPLPENYCELGQIVTGQKPGRTDDKQLIVNINLGLSLNDIRIAPVVLEKAMEMGLGTKLPYNVKATPIPLSA
jgi:ornithine cyclodeaminase/alanine dehydrogenase